MFNLRLAVKKCIKDFKPKVIINANSEPAVLNIDSNREVIKITYAHPPTELKAYKHDFIHEIYRLYILVATLQSAQKSRHGSL